MPNESDEAHASRVKDYMIVLTDEQFSAFGYNINSTDPQQERFMHFYSEMLAQRADLKRGKEAKPDR